MEVARVPQGPIEEPQISKISLSAESCCCSPVVSLSYKCMLRVGPLTLSIGAMSSTPHRLSHPILSFPPHTISPTLHCLSPLALPRLLFMVSSTLRSYVWFPFFQQLQVTRSTGCWSLRQRVPNLQLCASGRDIAPLMGTSEIRSNLSHHSIRHCSRAWSSDKQLCLRALSALSLLLPERYSTDPLCTP